MPQDAQAAIEADLPGFRPLPEQSDREDGLDDATATMTGETGESFPASIDPDVESAADAAARRLDPDPPVGRLPETVAALLSATGDIAHRVFTPGDEQTIWRLDATEAGELAGPLARILARRLPAAAGALHPDIADGMSFGSRLLAFIARNIAAMRAWRAARLEPATEAADGEPQQQVYYAERVP